MRQTPFFYLIPFLCVFTALAIGMAFLNPVALLLVLLSMVIQAPIIWIMAQGSYTGRYLERAEARREQFELDGDAAKWLAAEEEEANSKGYRYWSKSGRIHSMLNRARALRALERDAEARALLSEIDPAMLGTRELERYSDIIAPSAAEAEPVAAASPPAETAQEVTVVEETVVAEELELPQKPQEAELQPAGEDDEEGW